MSNTFQYFKISLICLCCSCNNSKTREKEVKTYFTRQDSLDKGILYSANLIQHENNFAIDSIPFGLSKKEFQIELKKFLNRHKVDETIPPKDPIEKAKWEMDKISAKFGNDMKKGHYLGDFKIQDVYDYYDNTGLYRVELVGDPLDNTSTGYFKKPAHDQLNEYLREKYGTAHIDNGEVLRKKELMQDGMYYILKSWKLGKKRIDICYNKQKEVLIPFLAIYLTENDYKAR
jgi:hypothetical protein